MRTRNEKILLAVLVLIIFGTLNFYGYKWMSKKQVDLQMDYLQLKGDQAEAEIDLQKQDLWTQRKAWIKDHEPALSEEGDAKAQVLQYVQNGARDHKLEIMEQSLNDVQHGPAGTRVNVTIKVKGPMEGLCQWIADLQKPENFYAVSTFSLKADQDQKSMVCTLQCARYFKGGN